MGRILVLAAFAFVAIAHRGRTLGGRRHRYLRLQCNPFNGLVIDYPAALFIPYLRRTRGILPLPSRQTPDVHLDDCPDSDTFRQLQCRARRFEDERKQVGEALLSEGPTLLTPRKEPEDVWLQQTDLRGLYRTLYGCGMGHQHPDEMVRIEGACLRRCERKRLS